MAEFSMPVRVYYEDTDSGGVVYHANYLNFFERARTEYLRTLGFEQDELIAREQVIFAVRAANVDYLQPARFNDLLTVTAKVEQAGRASLSFVQEIRRQKDNGLLCQARVKIACLHATRLRPCAMPEKLREVIARVD